jgi:hypothetical protein
VSFPGVGVCVVAGPFECMAVNGAPAGNKTPAAVLVAAVPFLRNRLKFCGVRARTSNRTWHFDS